jgi:hypothetical protein
MGEPHSWRMIGAVARVIISMRRPGATASSSLGNFSASDGEIAELRELLEGREPFEVLECIPRGLIWDALDILRSDGYEARVTFHEDH